MVLETARERFYKRFTVSLTGCWLWDNGKEQKYGQFKLKGVRHGAHRISWLIHNGPIPDGLWVLHSCDTPGCVNPGHLFLGTNSDNMKDMGSKGRQPKGPCKARNGSVNGRATLDEVSVLLVRELAGGPRGMGRPKDSEGKLTYRSIAAMLDLSVSVVTRIVRKETWRSV